MNLPMDKRKEALRDQALEAMTRRAKNSNYEKIHYVYRPKDDEGAASEKATAKSTSKEDPTEA